MSHDTHSDNKATSGMWYTYFGKGGAAAFAFLWLLAALFWIFSVLKWG